MDSGSMIPHVSRVPGYARHLHSGAFNPKPSSSHLTIEATSQNIVPQFKIDVDKFMAKIIISIAKESLLLISNQTL